MKYRIMKIESREKKWERIIFFSLIIVYFLAFVLSELYIDCDFAEWVFLQYKKLPY